MLVDFYCYRPPDELAVSMADVRVAWNDKRKADKEASVSAPFTPTTTTTTSACACMHPCWRDQDMPVQGRAQ